MRARHVPTRVLVLVIASLLTAPLAVWRLSAQGAPASRIDTHPDVQTAPLLFTAWIEGQVFERGLPGLAVGVVSDQSPVTINPAATNLDNPTRLVPIGNGQFRFTAPTGGGPVGEIVRFVEENGRVVCMITGDSYVARVDPAGR